MLELNIHQEKSINFEVTLSGIDPNQLSGSLRFLIDGIEYGFPVHIQEGNVSVSIPPLKNIITNKKFQDGESIHAKLDVTGNGYYLNPWEGSFTVKHPMVMEAKITEKPKVEMKIKNNTKSSLSSMKKIKENKKIVSQKKKPIIKEQVKPKVKKPINITKDLVYKFMAREGTFVKSTQDLLYEQAQMKVGDNPKDILKFFINFYKKDD